MVAASPAPAPAETWPPSPPASTTQQRGYFSEMLQYGLSREDVTSSTVFTSEEPKTRPPVPASTYNSGGAAPVSNSIVRVKTEGVEPKVIMAAKPKPGGMPRALEIHRRTKLYASQDITQLLKERGIDYSVKFKSEVFGKVGAPSTKLPLEAFDDASYEVREPQDWLAYGEALPCKALVLDDDEVGVWQAATVTGYDFDKGLYTVAGLPKAAEAPAARVPWCPLASGCLGSP